MSLSAKIAATLTALILTLTVVGGFVQQRVFGDLFSVLERDEAREDLRRVHGALEEEIEQVAQVAERYAVWDPTRDLFTGKDEAFAKRQLEPSVMQSELIDLLYFCTPEGVVAAGQIVDPATGEVTSLRSFPSSSLSIRHPMIAWSSGDIKGAKREGFLLTQREPLLAASRLVEDETGNPLGIVIAGRFLGTGLIERVAERTEVRFQAWSLERPDEIPAQVYALKDRITASTEPIVQDPAQGAGGTGETVAVHSVLDDVRGRQELLLRAVVAKEVTAAGSTALMFSAVADATLGLAILLGLLFILNVVVLKPVRALTDHAVRTGQDENFRAKFGVDRKDEIGTLGREFDEMMAKLEQARSALVDTARTAGMSEIATGILHNVGNVLNSVNISTSLVSQRVDGLCIDDLERLAEVLEEHKDDLAGFLESDPRGQHIQPFLSALVEQLGEEQRTIRGEIASLSDGIDHICELIKSQQSLAKGTRLIEVTDLAERMDEALRITQRALGVDPELVVVRRYDDVPEVELDRHKLLEILVNLMQNARQAMQSYSGTRELVLEVSRLDDRHVTLAVTDSGIGIDSEHLTKVFAMGFTTREEGHGFGLHSSANSAKEMGGSLRAESEGLGKGARFVLELPMAAPGYDRDTASAVGEAA